MTPEQRQIFLDNRKRGIGGSDAGSLLSNQIEVEYGCERALWARLSGIPPDNPEEPSEPMLLGTLLEPWVATAYANSSGRQLEEVGLKKHHVHESLQVHVDRLIHPLPDEGRTTKGVLEIKTVGREMWRKIQEEGIPVDYIAQWQHGAACYDTDWGAFAVGLREDLLPLVVLELAARLNGEQMPVAHRHPYVMHFPMAADMSIRRHIEEYGPKFWATVGKPDEAPPRLEPEDPRCGRCPRRIWCQGAALMEGIEPETHIRRRQDLAPLVYEYRTNMALLEQCQELVSETEEKFKTALGTETAVSVPVDAERGQEWKNVIYRLRRGSARIDGKTMSLVYDALRKRAIEAGIEEAQLTPLAAEFMKQGMPSRPLRLSAILPKKPKRKGEVPEDDEAE